MTRPTHFAALLPLLLALGMILSGFASPPPASKPVIPALPANLSANDLPDSMAYSRKAQAWLKKAADELSSLLLRKPGCSETQPRSAACL